VAENLLEEKSRDLFLAKQKLENQAIHLSSLVDEKTNELSQALETARAAITAMEQTERRLIDSEQKFRSFIENANDIVFTLNVEGYFDYLSPRLTDVLGYLEEDLLGQHFSLVIHPEDLQNCADFFQSLLTTQKPKSGLEYRVRHTDGTWHWHDTNAAPLFDKDDNLSGMLGIGRDIQERKRNQERLYLLANFDTLTDLANRSSILAHLTQELEQAKMSKTSLAVMFLDLNNFKNINDTHGHETGDIVLREVAMRLKVAVREHTDAVGRLAGDEFLVVLPDVDSQTFPEVIAQRIREALAPPIKVADNHLIVGCSIGVSIYPQDAHDVDTLVSHADTAMYEHKSSKTGDAVFFTVNI
jgi:diguanylate cyclase (GGDEF)-like protein/PAS domain S-box-containing protein